MKLGQKVMLGVGGILLLTTTITVGVLVRKQDSAAQEAYANLRDTILNFSIGKLEVAVASDRVGVIEATIEELREFQIVHGLILRDKDGERMLSFLHGGGEFVLEDEIKKALGTAEYVKIGKRHYYNRKIHDEDADIIGSILVCFDPTSVEARANADLWTAILTGGSVFVIALLLIPVLMRRITRPLSELRDRINDISAGGGDLTARVEVTTSDEIGELASSFNAFVGNLRRMLIEIRDATSKIDVESKLIDRDSQAIHHQVEEQEHSITGVRGVVESLASAFYQTRAATAEVDELSQVSKDHAQQGVTRISAVADAMAEIKESNTQIAAAMEKVNAIAFQTNLLALNAAVEAARAGHDGSGFAVVAGEVRSLASRSSDTATGISEVIERSTTSTERAASSLIELQETLGQIANGSNDIKTRLTTVNTAVRDQVGQVEDVSRCFEEVKRLAQESSTNTVRLAIQSERTAAEVATLNELIGQFRL